MMVRPVEDIRGLGPKNVETSQPEVAFSVYRKRFSPLADDLELKAELADGSWTRSSDSGVVGQHGSTGDSSADVESSG